MPERQWWWKYNTDLTLNIAKDTFYLILTGELNAVYLL